MKAIALVLGIMASAAIACDYQFDRVEFQWGDSKVVTGVNVYTDDEGKERQVNRIIVPLNENVHKFLTERVESREPVCVYGSYWPGTVRQYFIYRAE